MKIRNAVAACSLTALLGMICGCESVQPEPPYHPTGPTSTMRTGIDAGVEINLDPFVEASRTLPYFGLDAAADGIGIVFVRISNRSPDQTFLIEKSDFQLVPAGGVSGQTADTTGIKRGTGGYEAEAWLEGTMGAMSGLASWQFAVANIAHEKEVQRNFLDKELPDQTLPPGQSMEGFIYFSPVRKHSAWIRGTAVNIGITNITTHQPVSIKIPLT